MTKENLKILYTNIKRIQSIYPKANETTLIAYEATIHDLADVLDIPPTVYDIVFEFVYDNERITITLIHEEGERERIFFNNIDDLINHLVKTE